MEALALQGYTIEVVLRKDLSVYAEADVVFGQHADDSEVVITWKLSLSPDNMQFIGS